MDGDVDRHEITVGRFGNEISKVEPATAAVYGPALPIQFSLAGGAKIDQKAAVDGACYNETDILDRPPEQPLAKAAGA